MEEPNDAQEEKGLILVENSSLTPTSSTQIQISRQQERVIDAALKDDQLWARFLLIASAFGILLILGSLAEVAAGNITLALAQAIVGAAIHGITVLIQNPRKEAREQANGVYNNVIEAERFNAAIQLAATMDGEARNRVTEAIINKLINLEDKSNQIPAPSRETEENNPNGTLHKRKSRIKKFPKQQSMTEQEDNTSTNIDNDAKNSNH